MTKPLCLGRLAEMIVAVVIVVLVDSGDSGSG